ncbi:MAG TPA: hypothetical protein VH722_01535 [Alphaproteobacteria bacterium]|jgi:hypothetical protein|nr:hypothetical protein [Alphaproteobacteria bacterium]
MRTFRHIATATGFGLTLLMAVPAFAGTDAQSQSDGGKTSQPAAKTDQGQTPAPNATGDQPAPYGGNPLTSDQLNKEYQNLSPATRAALANQLKSKGLDGLTKMNEGDARTAFASLPPEVKSQIQAKWDAMSDEQRIALKKMGPAAVKEIVASQMREVMKQSVSPVTKPVAQVVEKVSSAAEKAKSIMQKGRDYVQGLIAKLKGQSSPPPEDNGSN